MSTVYIRVARGYRFRGGRRLLLQRLLLLQLLLLQLQLLPGQRCGERMQI